MYIELNNINKIQFAKVRIGGLTVLAGENDMGKSTVGKALFSIIKALIRKDVDFGRMKEKQIRSKIEEIYFSRRGLQDEMALKVLGEAFFPPQFQAQLNSFLDEPNSNLNVDNFIDRKKEIVTQQDINEKTKQKILHNLDELKHLILTEIPEVSKLTDALNVVLNSEFHQKMCSEESQEGSISLVDGDSRAVISVRKKGLYGINEDAVFYKPFHDAIFIETPLYLQLKDVFDKTGTLLDVNIEDKYLPKVPLHIKDLMRKIELIKYADEGVDENGLFEKLEHTMQGKFSFNKTKEEIVFLKELPNQKKIELSTYNVASGIKLFGIIQLLLNVNEIDSRKVLILDEPENHLHPKWQLELAKILVELLKADIPIVLTSHSPYFIQAIVHYAKHEKVEDLVSYYLAEPNAENRTIMNDVTQDLNRIFVTLATPMQEIL